MTTVAPTPSHLSVPPSVVVAVTAVLAAVLLLTVLLVVSPWRTSAPATVPAQVGDGVAVCEPVPVQPC